LGGKKFKREREKEGKCEKRIKLKTIGKGRVNTYTVCIQLLYFRQIKGLSPSHEKSGKT
jgi:hypothetical protein